MTAYLPVRPNLKFYAFKFYFLIRISKGEIV